MNPIFAEHVTGIAFTLSLSKNQVQALLRIERSKGMDQYLFHPHNARGLQHRGLIEHIPRKKGSFLPNNRIYRMTRAGELMCELLREAGFSLGNTTTKTTRKTAEYWGVDEKNPVRKQDVR